MKYKSNFITQVILKLDFDPIDDFNEELLHKFNEKIKNNFSAFHVKNLNMFTTKIENGIANTTTAQHPVGLFNSCNNNNQVILAPNSIAITLTAYETFNQYIELVKYVLLAFDEIVAKEFLTRIGLRFINNLTIPKKDPLKWDRYVNSSLFKPANNFFDDKQHIARSIGQTILNYDNCLVNFTYGVLNPDFPAKVVKNEFVLDYDCYAINIPNKDLFDNYINGFHELIETLFEKSITDNLRKLMGDKDGL